MRLIREVTEGVPQPVACEDGWNVGHLAHRGILLSCDGFSMRLDLEQLNLLFDYAEDGADGEIRDHDDRVVYVEVLDSTIVLSREGDSTYPSGIILDAETLKEMGIEAHSEAEQIDADGPVQDDSTDEDSDTIDPEAEEDAAEEELKEGVKRAFRRVGKKIKRGFRVTSGWRKGRVVASMKGAYKPRAKARTRLKLRIAAKKKRVIRILKGRITRRKPLSKRLVKMNKRVSGKK